MCLTCWKKLESQIIFTREILTFSQNIAYVVLTADFVDEAEKSQNKILNFAMIESRHTWECKAKFQQNLWVTT